MVSLESAMNMPYIDNTGGMLSHHSSQTSLQKTSSSLKLKSPTPTLLPSLQRKLPNSRLACFSADINSLLVRLVAGPSCDRFGPRYTFAACLLAGAIPTFLAGTIKSAAGLYVLRFFVGILGGSFVPCQVWTTGFFDKNIIGTANSLTAGLGNAGGGITYFLMPAIYNSLMKNQHESSHVAWRVSFIVPGVVITVTAIALILCCEDTPTGKWSDRHQAAENSLREHGLEGKVVAVPGIITSSPEAKKSGAQSPASSDIVTEEKKLNEMRGTFDDHEAQLGEQAMLDTARGEVIQSPSFSEIFRVIASPQTLVMGACYFCTFGTELSVNSVLGTYYKKNFPHLTLQDSGNWAAMFGLMNVVMRPLGGLVSDYAYRSTGSVWAKKILLHVYGVLMGAFLIAIGASDPHNLTTLVCLVGIGLAFFLEGANGLNYSLVPHVHPYANGVVSGFTGACGNLGGIVFAIIFRYNGKNYGKAIWIIGCIAMAVNIAVCWIKPIPKGQIGGR